MAKDVITRFKLETTQYDSKLKEEAKKLSDYSKTATQAKEGFNQFTKANVDAAKALGTMATSATNAKDRIKELVDAYNIAAKAYNSLTKEQQQGDWAQALAGSLRKLQQQIKDTKQEIQGLDSSMKNAGGGGLFAGLGGKMSGALQVFAGNMYTKAAEAVANLGSEMFATVKQGIELAKAGEGIRLAFNRLNDPNLLDGLREATHGTVTDIELMKAAVKFNDFKLPLDQLGTMLAFAQQKAKDTGDSVDNMVNSIVTGLGRQSLMILDNLGLSATEIKERMKQTGDMTKAVGDIIREQMAKAGDYVETAADRAAQANTSLLNKMDELGRKFAPVEEASNQLWTSMKISILDVVGGPLARLLNGLTEAGRLKNMLDDLNGGGNGKESQVEKALRILREYSGGGRGIEGKRDLYNRQMALFSKQEEKAWREANRLREEYKALKKQQDKGQFQGAAGKIVTDKLRELEQAENRAKAFQIMRANYEAGAKQILSPVKPVIDTSEAEQSITSLTKKLKDLQEQRKKAIAAGDTDLSKNLLKQINQTKADIKGLGGIVSTSTTHKVTPQERAAEKVSEAERTYAETLQKNSIRLEVGLDSTLDNKKKELSAQERLFDAYNDAYATYKDPAYKEAAKQAAEKIKQLAEEVKTLTDTQEASKKAARELESAQKKLADAQQKLADAQATGSATAVYKAQKDVDRQQGVVNRLQNPSLPVPAKPTGFEAYKQTIQAEIKFDQMQVDENTLHTLLQTALQNGLDGLTVDYSGLQERIAKGIDIPDSTWEALQEEINAKLKEMGIEPIKIDFKTGEVSSDKSAKKGKKGNPFVETDENGKETVNLSKAINGMADGISKAVGGIEQLGIKIPDGLKNVLGGIQTVTTIISGIATTVLAIAAFAGAKAVPIVGELLARGGIVGRAAGGLLIPGNSMSGDRLRMPVDGGRGMIGVNSGELILNRSQQDNIASQLEGGLRNIELTSVVRGEDIVLAINNRSRRMWRGEYVTSKKL